MMARVFWPIESFDLFPIVGEDGIIFTSLGCAQAPKREWAIPVDYFLSGHYGRGVLPRLNSPASCAQTSNDQATTT